MRISAQNPKARAAVSTLRKFIVSILPLTFAATSILSLDANRGPQCIPVQDQKEKKHFGTCISTHNLDKIGVGSVLTSKIMTFATGILSWETVGGGGVFHSDDNDNNNTELHWAALLTRPKKGNKFDDLRNYKKSWLLKVSEPKNQGPSVHFCPPTRKKRLCTAPASVSISGGATPQKRKTPCCLRRTQNQRGFHFLGQ